MRYYVICLLFIIKTYSQAIPSISSSSDFLSFVISVWWLKIAMSKKAEYPGVFPSTYDESLTIHAYLS